MAWSFLIILPKWIARRHGTRGWPTPSVTFAPICNGLITGVKQKQALRYKGLRIFGGCIRQGTALAVPYSETWFRQSYGSFINMEVKHND